MTPANTQVSETVELDTPIIRGDQTITSLTVRKPFAGELRGANLMALMQMDVQAAITVLPRITTPALTTQDVERMDVADLLQLASVVTGFLLPKSAKATAASPSESKTPLPTSH